MKIIRGLSNFNTNNNGYCVTIGNFDGVHKGHQKMIKYLLKKSKKYNLPNLIIIFEPFPSEFFLKKKEPNRITSFRDKILKLKLLGINNILCINFNTYFSKIQPQDFINKILIDIIHTKYLLIGEDFKFGYNRSGNCNDLLNISYKKGFICKIFNHIKFNKIKVSSSIIREHIKNFNFYLINQMMGKYNISGLVVKGNQLGNKLGFPTANVLIKNNLIIRGVFIVKVKLPNIIKKIIGVANIGTRPTINIYDKKIFLEIFLLNVSNITLYKEYISIVILHKIRDEIKFNSINKLKKQIKKDILYTNTFIQNIKL